jgi:hypothetical protein
MRSFYEIGTDSGTDKIWAARYDLVYAKHLEHFRYDTFCMLEIGVAHGQSLALWDEYFPKATYYGVDIESYAVNGENLIQADQSADADLQKLIDEIPECKFILDDGSHVPAHQIFTFEKLFKNLLKPGGTYIIEDVETSYWKREETVYGYPVGDDDVVSYFASKVHLVNDHYNRMKNDMDIASITFGRNAIIITKKTMEERFITEHPYRYSDHLK